MHPETEKAVSSSPSKGNTGVNREHASSLLNPCPATILPGISRNLSNLSASSEGNNGDNGDAFMRYERYRNDSGSHVSFGSQDTFPTFGGEADCNVWGDAAKFIPFKLVIWKLTWPEKVCKSRAFKRISICLILLHCLLCAVATADFVTDDPSVKLYFDLAKNMFVYVMSAELFLQFLYNRLSLFTNGWLVFDLIVVCSAWAFPNLLLIRTFRVVRTLRLASWVKDLKQLVLALLLVIPKMFAIFFLLFILFVIFSILFTDLFKHTYEDQITSQDYFGSLDVTFFTLFQIMTLDGWAEICKDIMKVYRWAWAPFIGFVVVSSFFFLNLVIAVVCEAVTSVHRDTVVKYIQDDISAATSVRDALKVEDRLEELAGSVQLMMQAQITVLETLQMQQAHLNRGGGGESSSGAPPPPGLEHEARLRKRKEELQGELDASFYGKTVQAAAKTARQRIASLNNNNAPGDANDDESNETSVHLNPVPQEEALREPYNMAAMSITAEGSNENEDQPMTFNSEAGPSTPAFWRQIGLTELQIARVLRSVSDQSNPTAQRPPPEAANPPRSPASPETPADQNTETRHPFS